MRQLAAKGRNKSGSDTSKRNRTLIAKGQGKRALSGRSTRNTKHPRGEEHSRRPKHWR